MTQAQLSVRPARTSDIPHIEALIEPYVQRRILLGKDTVALYEAVQEFQIAENSRGDIIGCGALHVMWHDLAEVRTVAVAPAALGLGAGRALVAALEQQAGRLGVNRLFCLTFEVEFFQKLGFEVLHDPLAGDESDMELYAELLRSHDEGIAEFLELSRVKQNTLGNTRMLKRI